VLDSLPVTIAGSVSGKLTQPNTLSLTTTQAASIGAVYLVGEVIGALVFSRLLACDHRRLGGGWRGWPGPVRTAQPDDVPGR
jgi:hypothetical protein